jgi:transcription elongation factor Elf1
MGKRKAARKPKAKIKLKLEKAFTCHFCNHDKSIEIKLDRESAIGSLNCRICGTFWQTTIHNLSEPVDVYSEWIDACEEAKAEGTNIDNGNTGPQTADREQDQYSDDNYSSADEPETNAPVRAPPQARGPTPKTKKPAHLKNDDDNLSDGFIADSDEEIERESTDEEPEAASSESEDDNSDSDKKPTPAKKRRLVLAGDMD